MAAPEVSLTGEAWRVSSEDELRAIVGVAPEMTRQKKKPLLDQHTRRFIEASPYVCVATYDGAGGADVSPRGDDRGFVRVLDDTTLVLPERPGNRLADTLTNVLRNPTIGLLFLLPGSPESLRVNGTAQIHHGPPSLLESMAARGRVPSLAIVVNIDEVFMHCGRASTRSRIWDRDMPYVDPRADRLIGEFLGMPEAEACEMLASYNTTDL
jgi:PPOX class probable FMN-dependent enzyme